MIDENDRRYDGVIKLLRELQQVKTPDNFEADLMRKVNSEKFHEEKTESWLSRIFAPKRFIPSAALAAAAVVILFVVKPGSTEIDNPFNTQPKLREDMITSSAQLSEEKKIDNELQKMIEKDKVQKQVTAKSKSENRDEFRLKNFQTDKPGSSYASQSYDGVSTRGFSGFYGIEKSGLNFRQVNLSKTERMEINRLKENLMRFMRENSLK